MVHSFLKSNNNIKSLGPAIENLMNYGAGLSHQVRPTYLQDNYLET